MEIVRCEMAIFLEDVAVVLERYGSTKGRVKWAHPCTSPSRRGKACSVLGGGSPSSALEVRPASVFALPRATIKSLPTSLDAMPSTNLLLAARKWNDHERIIARSRRLTAAAPQALRQLQQQRRARGRGKRGDSRFETARWIRKWPCFIYQATHPCRASNDHFRTSNLRLVVIDACCKTASALLLLASARMPPDQAPAVHGGSAV